MEKTWAAIGMALTAWAAVSAACRARPPCDGVGCAPACPRDAHRGEASRCACIAGNAPLLGACVPPAVGDAYCGPAATLGLDGCTFRVCADHELLDSATGECLPRKALAAAAAIPCVDGGASVVSFGRFACVPADAVCPRGSRPAGERCARPPTCPPGTLVIADGCRAVVTVGAHGELPRVDLGLWAALVLGADGGPGTAELCRPLALRPDSFGVPQGGEALVRLSIELVAPDEDLSQLHTRVRAQLWTAASPRPLSRPLSPEGDAVVGRAAETLVEALRSLGGEASTEVVRTQVSCTLRSL